LKFLLLIFVFATAACASTTVENVNGPDGSPHHLITCSDVKDCYERATKGCGKYQIINTSNQIYRDTRGRPDTMTKLLVKCPKQWP
jgi:hypothetical protein